MGDGLLKTCGGWCQRSLKGRDLSGFGGANMGEMLNKHLGSQGAETQQLSPKVGGSRQLPGWCFRGHRGEGRDVTAPQGTTRCPQSPRARTHLGRERTWDRRPRSRDPGTGEPTRAGPTQPGPVRTCGHAPTRGHAPTCGHAPAEKVANIQGKYGKCTTENVENIQVKYGNHITEKVENIQGKYGKCTAENVANMRVKYGILTAKNMENRQGKYGNHTAEKVANVQGKHSKYTAQNVVNIQGKYGNCTAEKVANIQGKYGKYTAIYIYNMRPGKAAALKKRALKQSIDGNTAEKTTNILGKRLKRRIRR